MRNAFTDPHSALFRVWHNLVTVLIFVSCIALALETVPEIEKNHHAALFWVEWLSVVVFTID